MTKKGIIKKAYGFQGANREFSQEMGPLVEAIVGLIGEPVLVVENITALTNAQTEALKAGDVVVKVTGNMKHAYKVTFRNDTGMCITYADAENVETVSYDKIEGVWTYNSTDITPIGDMVSINKQRAQLVTLCDALQTAEVITSYTIGETPTDGVFPITFNEVVEDNTNNEGSEG